MRISKFKSNNCWWCFQEHRDTCRSLFESTILNSNIHGQTFKVAGVVTDSAQVFSSTISMFQKTLHLTPQLRPINFLRRTRALDSIPTSRLCAYSAPCCNDRWNSSCLPGKAAKPRSPFFQSPALEANWQTVENGYKWYPLQNEESYSPQKKNWHYGHGRKNHFKMYLLMLKMVIFPFCHLFVFQGPVISPKKTYSSTLPINPHELNPQTIVLAKVAWLDIATLLCFGRIAGIQM